MALGGPQQFGRLTRDDIINGDCLEGIQEDSRLMDLRRSDTVPNLEDAQSRTGGRLSRFFGKMAQEIDRLLPVAEHPDQDIGVEEIPSHAGPAGTGTGKDIG